MTASVVPHLRSWRAPQGDRQTLVDPPLDQLEERIADNRRLTLPIDDRFCGTTVDDLRGAARKWLLEQAAAYSRTYRDVDVATDPSAPLILSGHQPDLVHCGVWFKHFVLHEAARRGGGTGVHLLIDNDAVRHTSIVVPTGTVADPRLVQVAYDRPSLDIPYEMRYVRDRSQWDTFGRRVAAAVRSLVPHPLIESLWPRVTADSSRPIGEAIAAGRHALEAQLGLQTLEIPLSRVCRSESFHWFVALLLADARRLRQVYNDVLAEYRRAHRLRNPFQPVPDLQKDGEAVELPLWIWSDASPQRRHLFVSRHGSQVTLTNRHDITVSVASTPQCADRRAVDQLLALQARGIRIRPRALTTTLFARWFLGDMFIHGIGGAVYDRVTDRIARRWWGAAAPHLMVATATCRLPVDRPDVTPEDIARIDHQLRELRYHPEQFIDQDAEGARQADVARWIKQKRAAIAQQLPRGRRKARHDRIVEANRAMQAFLQDHRTRLLEERKRLVDQWRRRQRLDSREFPIAVFPKTLPEELARLARGH